MADNVSITAGAGTTVAADEVVDATLGTVKVQYVKLMDATLDGTTKAAVNANGLKVDGSGVTLTDNIAQVGGSTVATAATGIQKVGVTDSLGNSQFNFPAGFVRTSDEPRQMFYDPFDTYPDTVNTWRLTSGNFGVGAQVVSGQMTMGTGTVASGWSKLYSIPTFRLTIPAWTGFSFAIAIPDLASPTANSYRFWGTGTIPDVPTTSAPLTDAVGFELATDGKMYAVVYASGTRTVIADLSSATGTGTQPTTATMHRYIVYVRTDKSYFYIDGLASTNLVATANFQAPSLQILPITMLALGGSTPPVSNAQLQCTGAVVWDTGKNASQIADGTLPWRKATVTSGGGLKTAATITDAAGVYTQVVNETGAAQVYNDEMRRSAEMAYLQDLAAMNNLMDPFHMIDSNFKGFR